MKKLDLKACQVQELDFKQMQEQSGGVHPCCVILGVYVGIYCLGALMLMHGLMTPDPIFVPPIAAIPVAVAVLRERYRAPGGR